MTHRAAVGDKRIPTQPKPFVPDPFAVRAGAVGVEREVAGSVSPFAAIRVTRGSSGGSPSREVAGRTRLRPIRAQGQGRCAISSGQCFRYAMQASPAATNTDCMLLEHRGKSQVHRKCFSIRTDKGFNSENRRQCLLTGKRFRQGCLIYKQPWPMDPP